MLGTEYQAHIKAETVEADPSIDFGSGATILELVDPSLTLAPQKVVQDINSNWAHPFRRKMAFGRDNTGQLPTLLHKADRALLMQLIFGGLTSGVPAYNTSYAIQSRKSTISGQLALGVKARQTQITAAAGGPVALQYDLVARKTTKISAPTIGLPTTLGTPYRFATAIAVLNGAATNDIDNLNLTVANQLLPGPHRTSDLEIAYLEYGGGDITGSATFKFAAETYNDLVRGVATGYIYLLFGDALAIYGATTWNTADLFTNGDTAILWNGSALSAVTVTITAGALANAGATGNVLVQNPVLIKLNAVEVPSAPENITQGVVKQTLNFTTTAPSSGTTPPVQVFIDAVT